MMSNLLHHLLALCTVLSLAHPFLFAECSLLPLPANTSKLSGAVDDCYCQIETIEEHIDQIHSILTTLTKCTFFKYVKIDFLRECPFWVEEYLCSITEGGGCGVCVCEENEVPAPWIEAEKAVDRTLGPSLERWRDDDEDVWTVTNEKDAMYINLQLNPEHHTGYGGYNSTRIWYAIYQENCFHSDGEPCFEKRVFYRLLSGLHASITLSICENYHDQATGKQQPNLECYQKRIGNFPDRLKNVYFTLLFLVRAVVHTAPHLKEYHFNTGNPEDDVATKAEVNMLLSNTLLQGLVPTFNESEMFQSEGATHLKKQFMAKFRNISEIMDCVACESCKVHAKLNMLGLGTALKILLVGQEKRNSVIENLQRNEIIALINTLFKYSTAVQTIRQMEARRVAQEGGGHQAGVSLADLTDIV